MAKLICEKVEDVKVLKENVEIDGHKFKNYYLTGVFMQCDIKNRNGRVYPLSVVVPEVQRYNETYVRHKRAFGELSHPDGPTINMERVSHLIVELRQEGTDFVGKAKILDTPYGKIVKNFIDEGCSLGVSSRAVASLRKRGGVDEVQEDFMLCTAGDIVSEPSAPSAFVNGIMENKEWIFENGVVKSVEIENYKKIIQKTDSSAIEHVSSILFEDFMGKLAKGSMKKNQKYK